MMLCPLVGHFQGRGVRGTVGSRKIDCYYIYM